MSTVKQTGWVGWGRFAAVILLLNGAFSFMHGLVAILAPNTYFVTSEGSLFILDLSGWGWWSLIIGILLIGAGAALLAGAMWARVIAIILASISAIAQLLLIPVQPWWALIIIAVDILVIYALTAHGRELETDT